MKLQLAFYGHPVLRKKTSPVSVIDDKIRQLVYDMVETMDLNDGVGLAAPQVHRSLSIFVTRIPHWDEQDKIIPGEVRVFINPKILSYTQETWACQEGCLSIPGISREVNRPSKIRVEATDLEGKIFEEEFTFYDAHVIMHENDHINGVLFIDRLPPKEKKDLENFLREVKKKYNK